MSAVDHMLGQEEVPLKGLIVSAGNPLNTHPNTEKTRRAFERLELLVVRDLFRTETADLAHYVLPAASFLERSELHYYAHLQTVCLSHKVLEFPEVLDEYAFWKDLADRLGFGERYFPWRSEEEVNRWVLEPTRLTLEELRQSPAGLSYASRQFRKYLTRPLPTSSGKFEFVSSLLPEFGYPALPEFTLPWYKREGGREFPFALISGTREMRFYHSRYHNIAANQKARPRPWLLIHPEDAARLGIGSGQRVRVVSETGWLEIGIRSVKKGDILPGVLQMAHGWPGSSNVNLVTADQRNDPLSGYPLLKSLPVRLEREGGGAIRDETANKN